MGKPYQSQDPDNLDQQFSDEEVEASQTLNETVHSQEKRQASNPCVKKWYYNKRFNDTEAICHRVSISCLRSIPRSGFPKCVPVYEAVNHGRLTLRRTKSCTCA